MSRKLLIHHLSFIIRKSRGFTLIELMVAISITAVLGTLGIVGFANYSQAQVLQTSANEVVTMLNLAKSRAQSQIKPSECVGDLKGYIVKIVSAEKSYTLYFNCSSEGKIDEQDKVLPTNLSFDADPSFFFPVQKGGVETPGRIVISGSSGEKTIVINDLGRVTVQ